MGTLSRIKIFLTFDGQTMRLFLEAFFYLAWARLLVKMSFSKIAPFLGTQMRETSNLEIPTNRAILISVHQAIHITSRHTFWESTCLVKAMAAMKMLEKRGIDSTLYLGTAKEVSGKMMAHAWLRSGPFFITGAEEMGQFTVVSQFAKEVSKKQKN